MPRRRACAVALLAAALGAGCASPVGTQARSSTLLTTTGATVAPLAATTTSTTAAPATTTSTTATSTTDGAGPGVLPDATFTPGATNPAVSAATIGVTVCRSGWTATVRPPAAYTDQVKRLEDGAGGTVAYQGVSYPVHGFQLADRDISHFELDHLVPLELGGNPADPRNLWMEPLEVPRGPAAPGTSSQTKDKVENAVRAAVCSGRLALVDAQQRIAANWYALGQQLKLVP